MSRPPLNLPTGQNSRRNHYIPKFLLKNFVDKDGKLWMCNRNDRKILQLNPINAFVEKDLYTLHDFVQSITTFEYEESFSKTEDKSACVVQMIIERARKGHRPGLSEEEGKIWKEFFVSIARRNPNTLSDMVENAGDAFYQSAKELADKDGFCLPDQETLYQNQQIRSLKKIVEQNSKARFAVGDHEILRKDIEEFIPKIGFRFARIVKPSKSFVVGSCGLSTVKGNNSNGLLQGSWLPISYDIAVQATVFPDREEFMDFDRSSNGDSAIRTINLAAAKQSHFFAGRSEELIRSLMDRVGEIT